MKKLLILLLLFASITAAQTYDFTLTVQNQQVSGSDFIFDIYMLRTGSADIYLGECDFVLTFNNGNFTSPVASVVTAESRIATWYTLSPTIEATNRIILNVQKAPFSNQTDFDNRVQVIGTSGNGTLIAQIKITNISNAGGTAGLQWRTSDLNKTNIQRLDNTDPWALVNITSSGTYTNPSDASLPVSLASFNATSTPQGVLLTWATESEMNNLGYILEKQLIGETQWTQVANYKTHDELKGQDNSTTRHDYSFTDKNVQANSEYTYRLSDVDKDGNRSVKKSIDVTVTAIVPKTTALLHPYPNPFNPETKIRYDLAKDANVDLFIVDILGRSVVKLIDNQQTQAGSYHITWNGQSAAGNYAASGTYFVVFNADNVRHIQKVVFLK